LEHPQVTVTGGVAVLSGWVSNILAKERAVSVAAAIRGVRSIVDQLVVRPIARTDQQLEADVKAAFHHDLATRPHPVAVAVKEGRVTLSGTADSWPQKTQLEDVAKSVPGVAFVDNALLVHYAAPRSESSIAADVKSRLANDVRLNGCSLAATVGGSKVILTGLVGSVAQQEVARSDAYVVGVDNVDNAAVAVDWRAFDDQQRTTTYAGMADAELADAVRQALRLDPRLTTLIPQVAVKSGVATLTGTVDTPNARQAAASDAQNTTGVWSVRNEVLVQPNGRPTDADVNRAVKQVLSEDPVLSYGKSIQVSTASGKVTLRGTIPFGLDRFDVLADLAEVPGVTEVEDDLTIARSSADIQAIIEDRLYWDPMVERDVVNVAVAPDGVTTLTGTVATWGELRAASNDALGGGAARVINLLKLNKHSELVVP
jgi:osmotically-inducible protein OsmY